MSEGLQLTRIFDHHILSAIVKTDWLSDQLVELLGFGYEAFVLEDYYKFDSGILHILLI